MSILLVNHYSHSVILSIKKKISGFIGLDNAPNVMITSLYLNFKNDFLFLRH